MSFSSKLYSPQSANPAQVLDIFRDAYYNKKYKDVNKEQFPERASSRGYLMSQDLETTMEFQFNPVEMSINKQNVWEYRSYVGKTDVDPIWIKGGIRTIAFELTFDATPGAATWFSGGKMPQADYDQNADINAIIFNQMNHYDYTRGTLDIVETLDSYQYPLPSENNVKRFENGVIVVPERFRTVPTLDFGYGPLLMKVKLTNLGIRHTAFNKQLTPVRTVCDVALTVIESIIIDTRI